MIFNDFMCACGVDIFFLVLTDSAVAARQIAIDWLDEQGRVRAAAVHVVQEATGGAQSHVKVGPGRARVQDVHRRSQGEEGAQGGHDGHWSLKSSLWLCI